MTALEQQLKEALLEAEKDNKSLLKSCKELESEYISSISTIAEDYKQVMQQQQQTHKNEIESLLNQQNEYNQTLLEQLKKKEEIDIGLEQELEALRKELKVLEEQLDELGGIS